MSTAFPYDPDEPIASLERSGVAVQRSQTTSSSSFSINGVDLGGSTTSGVQFTFTLPRASPLHVVFGEEKLSQKLLKIFKKELQVGDESFDKAVFITTSDQEVAGRFLADEDVRAIIYDIIVKGGAVSVEGQEVKLNMLSNPAPGADDRTAARFVCHVLAFEG
jgi:hypothetical protein